MFIQVAIVHARMIEIAGKGMAGQGMAGQHFLLTAGINSHALMAHVV